MKRWRALLLLVIWLSLLLVPYSGIAYLCYLGLCGGAEAYEIGKKYVTFYGVFMWGYPLLVFPSLYFSRRSSYVLCIPLLALLAFLYVELDVMHIHAKYVKMHQDAITPKADDYVCDAEKFVRVDRRGYSLFNYKHGSGSTTFAQSSAELQEMLQRLHVNPADCKTANGSILSLKTDN